MSYFFDGSSSGSIINFGDGELLTYPFSLFAWIYPLRTTADETVLTLRATGGDTWRIVLSGTTGAKVNAVSFSASSGLSYLATSTTSYVANKWQLVAARFDSNTNRVIFLDTEAVSNTTNSAQTGAGTISSLYIGTDPANRRFQGYIADISIRTTDTTSTPSVLNPEIINRLAYKQNPLKVRGSNVLVYWPLTSPGPQPNEAPNGPKFYFPLAAASSYAAGLDPGIQTLKRPVTKVYYLNPVIVTLTGQSATGAVGTVTTQQNVNYSVTGQSATGAVGTVTTQQNVNYSVTGQSATGAIGTVTTQQNVNYSVTGQSATGAVGTVTTQQGINYSVTGQSATGSAGTVTTQQNVNYSVTGQSATGNVGTASVVVGQLVSAVSVSAAGAAGTVTTAQNVQQSITGTASTGAVGTLSVVSNQTILSTGVSSNAQAGTVTASVQLIIQVPGVYAVGSVGGVIVWSPISPDQNPNWTLVDDSQSGAWTPINDSQTTIWSRVA